MPEHLYASQKASIKTHNLAGMHHSPAALPKLGSGGRFRKLVNQLKSRKVGQTARGRKLARALPGKTKKVQNPAALAAYIGRKKYGAKKFAALSIAGRK